MNDNENEKLNKDGTQQETPETPTADDVIKLAKERISKAEYDRVLAERDQAIADRNKVYKSVLDGESLPRNKEEKSLADLKKTYREAIHNPNATNLEVVTAQIELRDALVEAGEPDPFAPYNPSPEDLAAAKRVADVKRQCVEEADGDPKKFLYLFEQRIANDDPALLTAIKKRNQKKK